MSVGRDSGRLLAAQAVSAAAGIANGILIARALGPAARGVFVLVLTLAFAAVALGGLGIGYATTWLIVRGRRGAAELHANALLASLLLGAAVALLYAGAAPLLHEGPLRGVPPALAWAGIALVPLHLYGGLWRAVLAGLGRFGLVAGFEAAAAASGTVVTAAILYGAGAGAGGLLAGTVATAACGAAAQVILLRRIAPPRGRDPAALLAETVRTGFPGHLGNAAFLLLTRLDLFLVNLWLGNAAVGVYGLAAALAEKAWFLPVALGGAVAPELGRREPAAAAALGVKAARHALWLAVAGGAAVLAAAPWAVPLLYGEAFRGAVAPLALLLPGTVAVAASLPLSAHLSYQAGRPQLTAVAGWAAAALYLPVAFALIPRRGIEGAALASSGAYLALGALTLLFFRRETGARIARIARLSADDVREYAALLRPRRRRPPAG